MKQTIDEIKETLDTISQKKKEEIKFKKKSFKLPFQVKSQLKKLATKNKIQVILLQRNKNIKPTIGEIREGMLMINNEVVHDCPMDCVGLWNGKIPTVILPEYDLKPMSWSENYNNTVEGNRLSDPQKIIIRAIEFKESNLMKKQISIKAIVLTIVVVIIIMAVLFGGGIV